MARVTVEDCIDKVDSPYELVLVAKERATQLNSGLEPTLDKDNDKNTVISLREIAEEKIKVPDLIESAVYKLRKHVEQVEDTSEEDEEIGDDFENLYKGEISKSGMPILPSKRARKIPEKIQVFQDDLAELKNTTENQPIKEDLTELKNTTENQSIADTNESSSEGQNDDLSIEDLKEVEADDTQENTDTSNS
jgi:DNA-directed RNA polymerase subunit omega